MAKQEFFVGSVGPLIYEDTRDYPDGVPMRAFRGPQIYLDDAPTDPNEVARKEEVDAITQDGVSETIAHVIVNARLVAGVLEVRHREITTTNGIVTAIGDLSDWVATPIT